MTLQNYSSDAPINDPALDLFNRFPFAQRVASVISNRKDPSSIVIGIYGAWGEGKTSVFNFIESELQPEKDIVCLKFNPWRFGDEDQMLVNFFNDLAIAIDRSIESGKEKLGEFIERYGKPIGSLFGKGDVFESVASFLSGADIEELRKRIENLLKEEKKRVVILVDDIDRLEKNEVHSLFRLVKLTADFKYTAYVLAFDKKVVTSALQERYGTDSKETGNSFLEKIIQVPLQLPSIDSVDLRTFCLNEIRQVLDYSNIELTYLDYRQFVSEFSKGLEIHLKTPRQAKLYSNILMFSLPILKDEVNVIDLMLIEGIRVLLPTIYTFIKSNKKLFLGEESNYFLIKDEKLKIRRKERIEEGLEGFSYEEKEQIRELLCFLFPKINTIFRNVSYGNEWEEVWSEKKRISSPQYFQRYFSYAISKRDISDIVIEDLLKFSEVYNIDDIISKIQAIMNDNNANLFIAKLRRASKNLTLTQSKKLAVSLAKLGNDFPKDLIGQGALLISDIIENVNDQMNQINLAKEVIFKADSLSFAMECFSWFRRDTKEHPNPLGFTIQAITILEGYLAERISLEFCDKTIIQIDEITHFPYILAIWNKHGRSTEATDTITQMIKSNQNFVFELLDAYRPTSFREYELTRLDFSDKNYKSLKKIINPNEIVQAIKKEFDNIQLPEQYPKDSDLPRNELLAMQFLWLHHNIEEEEE